MIKVFYRVIYIQLSDLSTSMPSLANILVNQTHLNNHSAFATTRGSRSPIESTSNSTLSQVKKKNRSFHTLLA